MDTHSTTSSFHLAAEILGSWMEGHHSLDAAAIADLRRQHPTVPGDLEQLVCELRELQEELPSLDVRAALGLLGLLRGAQSVEPHIDLDATRPDVEPRPLRALIRRLIEHRPHPKRYVVRDEIARGGMGIVYRVWDRDLRRHLAMKVLRERDPPLSLTAWLHQLARFLEEAQVTSQLQHPSIVAVYELGIDSEGKIYFTMPLVRGQDLLALLDTEVATWSRPRTLHVFVKILETLAFAHAHGVTHRDIKPANIMVGRFGETYIMDWGLARVMAEADGHEFHLAEESTVGTDRRDAADGLLGSPVLTIDGQVVGTPCYMAPEQAGGRLDEVGPWSDVYGVGAVLYHALVRRAPYLTQHGDTPAIVLGRVRDGPPVPLLDLDPSLPRPLVAICEKAMARRPQDRYAGAAEMARDIEAWLDHRPTVAAHPGRLEVLGLAFRRNRLLITAVTTITILVMAILTFFLVREKQQIDAYRRMLDFMTAQALQDQVESVYPISPASVPAMEQWLARVHDLLARLPEYARESSEVMATRPPTGREREDMLRNAATLQKLLPIVTRHHELARSLREASIEREREAWQRAAGDIAGLPVYGGLRLLPQEGLVPLRRDPTSGLWEFWVVASGARPTPSREHSGYDLAADSGIVVVLVPGGVAHIGSPDREPGRRSNEGRRDARLDPFFVGKYEVTQGVWERTMAGNPSSWRAGAEKSGYTFTALHPVELVSWNDASRFCHRLGLELPSEAQWEYGCRAGCRDAYAYGPDPGCLEGHENILDKATRLPECAPWSDPFPLHAPVGSFEPNVFGLYDVHGNVQEWCRDSYQDRFAETLRAGDGLQVDITSTERSIRGGSWFLGPANCRAAFRTSAVPWHVGMNIGLRVARAIDQTR